MRYLKVAIDKGHNCPPDTGAVANGVTECSITEQVGELVIRKLEGTSLRPVRVNPARCSTVNQSLTTRVNLANQAGCGLYLSIHCNAFASSAAKGTECYFYPGNADGRKLSELLSSEISKVLRTTNRGAKEGNFYVLRATNMTAVLLELGFITNVVEARAITENIEKLADTIVNTLLKFTGYEEESIELCECKPNLKPLMAFEHVDPGEEINYSIFNKQKESEAE